MTTKTFEDRQKAITNHHCTLLDMKNSPAKTSNGIFQRWENPVITAEHIPLDWRYDFNPKTNPFFMERIGVNAAFNAGAIKFNDRYVVAVRVEGVDRKSFFAIAESENGVDGFRFWSQPVVMPQTDEPDTNVYDMRLTHHEDGWIYGLFCTERKDLSAMNDLSAAIAQCGIARTKDLKKWERLSDLKTRSAQQRNVVLHPEFIDGKYAFYTRPQDGFISVGAGGGIGWGACESIENAVIDEEILVQGRTYHTINEGKNGQGPTPLKTADGWLHIAHGVRNTAAGLRYVLYLIVTELEKPWQIKYAPGGHLIAPLGAERVGDVSNVAFCNGWVRDEDGKIFIYYASSDTRLHVATTSEAQLLDYARNTPPDGLTSAECVNQRLSLINSNMQYVKAGV